MIPMNTVYSGMTIEKMVREARHRLVLIEAATAVDLEIVRPTIGAEALLDAIAETAAEARELLEHVQLSNGAVLNHMPLAAKPERTATSSRESAKRPQGAA